MRYFKGASLKPIPRSAHPTKCEEMPVSPIPAARTRIACFRLSSFQLQHPEPAESDRNRGAASKESVGKCWAMVSLDIPWNMVQPRCTRCNSSDARRHATRSSRDTSKVQGERGGPLLNLRRWITKTNTRYLAPDTFRQIK